MEEIIHRLVLVGTVIVIALNFPEAIAWHRLKSGRSSGPNPIEPIHQFLRKLLKIEFFFYIILLAYAVYHPAPSRYLVYPLAAFQLPSLIIGERNLPAQIPRSLTLQRIVRFMPFYNCFEIALLTLIGLEIHGVVTL